MLKQTKAHLLSLEIVILINALLQRGEAVGKRIVEDIQNIQRFIYPIRFI